jgi:diaminohydroxyphosphoribosylaminopyrimidine deaminase/5-amino-6-(5-phosphoribosylamino)uracil reductase
LAQLGTAGVTSLLLEGGPHLAGCFLDAGEIDEMRLFLAPLVLGGKTARDPLEGEGVEKIADAVRALTLDCTRIGEDLMVAARMREW